MTTVFKAPVHLEALEVGNLRQEFDRLANAKGDVVIDLARTEALDGSGVGALVYAFKRLVANGNGLTVRNVSGQPLNLLNESGLLRTLGSERSEGFLRAAVRGFRQQRIISAASASDPSVHDSSIAGVDRTKGAA